jgi:hypothetical protein
MAQGTSWAVAASLALAAVQCGGTIATGETGTGGTTAGGTEGNSTSGTGGKGSAGTDNAGRGGVGTAGASNAGRGGTGTAGTSNAGKGGTGTAGTSNAGTGGTGTAGSSAGGSSSCTPNYSCRPAPPAATGDPFEDCVARINQFRACVCLGPLQRWNAGESCAGQDVAYDRARSSAHAGFLSNPKICTPQGRAENECLGGSVTNCIQSMFNEGPPPQNPCKDACYQQHGHFINMTSTSYTHVACGFDGNWAVQNFE